LVKGAIVQATLLAVDEFLDAARDHDG